ncbi:MAG: hypothetical protein DRN92_02895 [Thermoproteota archaeon]|nr:MAG: hypothetical protein DRN92_02895 [Candidatus Korarchaeota archaeon]
MRRTLLLSLVVLILSITILIELRGAEEDLRPFCPLKTVLMTKEGPKALIIYGQNAAQMDVEAAELIADYVTSIGGEATVINASSVTQSELRSNHLIVVGGPVANSFSETVNETSRFLFILREDGWYFKLDFSPGGTWGGELEVGVVGAMPSPWNENYTLIYVAGINRYATYSSALELVELGDSTDYWAVVVLNRYGSPLPIRDYKIYEPPPTPPELSFLNITKEGGVPSGVTRVWVITQNKTGWYVIRGADPNEYPLNGKYNAFCLEKNVNQSRSLGLGENVTIFLGVYSSSLSYSMEAPAPWTWASLRYNPLYSNFTVFVEGAVLSKDQLVAIPWTEEKAFLQIETIEPDGRFELVVFEYSDGALLGTSLVRLNLTTDRYGSFDISPGPDGNPTTISFYIPSFSLTAGWARIDLRIDYGPQADHSLNLTDVGEVGDDLYPWDGVGLLADYQSGKLWIVKTQRIFVPFYEGLVKDSFIDPYVWTECKPYILDDDDWLVATIPISGD